MIPSKIDLLALPDLPRRFGRYDLQGILGEGGMARVFKAELLGPAGFRKAVAVKVIKTEAAGRTSAGKVRAFVREARLGGLLKHPNIVDVYELGEAEGQFFICMELVEGLTLAPLIRSHTQPPATVLLEIAIAAAAGLASAHGLGAGGRPSGLVHRDLKPSNVLLSWDGAVKIADFGIAITRRGEMAASFEEADEVVGTVSYMSPEQLLGQPLDGRSDLFSLGLVLTELAAARPLPRRYFLKRMKAEAELSALILPAQIMAAVNAAVPGLSRIIRRCVQPRPDDRYPTAEELCSELENLSGEFGVHPRLRTWLPQEFGHLEPFGGRSWVPQQQGMGLSAPEDEPSTSIIPGPRGRTNLGPAVDGFVGRGTELAQLGRLFEEGARLVTVKGTGGAGKTRFARRLARGQWDQRPGGAWFVDLTEARSPMGVVQATATALEVPLGGDDLDALVRLLGHAIAGRGSVLVVLDNFEQVVDYAPGTLGAWLDMAPEASFLVTSREPLKLSGEQVFTLDPLPEDDAVALFELRAAAAGAAWQDSAETRAAIVRIVSELDGLPLAIELAAARANLLSPAQLLARLSQPFRLLRGGRRGDTRRQATLRGMIRWSWDLLQPWEQSVMAQLAAFRGGFFMEAAEEVLDLSAWPEAPWSLDVVGSLLDKSLLRNWEVLGLPRFGMYLSVREYAAEELIQGAVLDADPTALRPAAYFARFGMEAYRDSLHTHGGTRRRRLLALERENLLAGVESAITAGEASLAAACALGAWELFRMSGPFLDGAEVLGRVLAMEGVEGRQRMRLLGDRAWLLHLGGEAPEALAQMQAALVLARELGERRSEGIWLGNLGSLSKEQGRIPEALEQYEAALALAGDLGDRRYEGSWLGSLGLLHMEQGRIPEALEHTEAALALARELGHGRNEGIWLGNLALMHRDEGRISEALEHLEAALAMARELGDRRAEGIHLGNLGDIFIDQEDWKAAGHRFRQAIPIGDETWPVVAGVFRGSLALVRAQAGDLAGARSLLERGEEQLREVHALELGKLLCKRCRVEHGAGEVEAARSALDEARAIAVELGLPADSQLGRAIDAAPEMAEPE